jgi:integrase
VEAFIEHCFENDQSIKSTLNYLALLHAIFEYARKKKWCRANPCTTAEKPDLEDDGDIRFLDKDELEALYAAACGRLKHAPQSIERHHAIVRMRAGGRPWKAISTRLGIGVSTAHYLLNIDPEAISLDEATFSDLDPVVYMTAAMTGLRRGELLALRWMDIDWLAQKVRVRRKYSRGKFGPTKGKRPRAVPLPTRLARELELLFQRSQWQADEDLVFGHPISGEPLKERHLYARFKRSLERAGVREVRFHDLRHTFGTMMAANPRVSMRRLQEWMGHRDLKTTLKYADYAPAENEAAIADETFGHQTVIKLSETGGNGDHQNADEMRGVQ